MNGEAMHHRSNQALSQRRRAVALAGLGTAIVLVAVFVNRESTGPVLVADLLLVAAGGPLLLFVGRGGLAGWMPWIVSGGLLGATPLTLLQLAPWSLAAAAVFAAAGLAGRRESGTRLSAGSRILAVAAAANAAMLWFLIFGEHRPVPPAEFKARELRMNQLLAEVPLRDLWVAHLRGGPADMTMPDLRWQLVDGFRHNLNTGFVAVAGIRELLGSLLGWDQNRCQRQEASLVHRLTEADRRRSLTEPGDSLFVYTFEREALIEIKNCTVHAFIGIALERVDDGYDLYWAFFVKRVGWITPFYMALIEPFRRTVVYPPLIEGIEREWLKRWSGPET